MTMAGGWCWLVPSSGTRERRRAQVEPVLGRLGLRLESADASDAPDASRLADPSLIAVIVDCIDDWTAGAGYWIGRAEAAPAGVIVLVSSDGMPVRTASSTRRVRVPGETRDAEVLVFENDLDEALRGLTSDPIAEPRLSLGHPAAARVAVPPGDQLTLTREAAEQLLIEFFADGLSTPVIEAELLRLGAPKSWVRARLFRRPGW
jgi:hypothetical protein